MSVVKHRVQPGGAQSTRYAKINALLRRKLIPSALPRPGDFELFLYRQEIAAGTVEDPWDVLTRTLRAHPEIVDRSLRIFSDMYRADQVERGKKSANSRN